MRALIRNLFSALLNVERQFCQHGCVKEYALQCRSAELTTNDEEDENNRVVVTACPSVSAPGRGEKGAINIIHVIRVQGEPPSRRRRAPNVHKVPHLKVM